MAFFQLLCLPRLFEVPPNLFLLKSENVRNGGVLGLISVFYFQILGPPPRCMRFRPPKIRLRLQLAMLPPTFWAFRLF